MAKVSKGGIKISIYGRPKTGKTRLAATFPKPMLILGTEDGTASIRNVSGVSYLQVISSRVEEPKGVPFVRLSELNTALEEAKNSQYQTLVLDTASMLQDLVLADILGIEKLPAQKSWGLATKEQNQQNALQTKTLIREVLGFPRHVVIVAHERNFGNDDAGSEIRSPVVSSSLSESVGRYLNGEVDYICQTFIRDQVEYKDEVIAGEKVSVPMRTGKAEYCLRLGDHPVFTTGFRLTPGYELPEVLVNPTFAKIEKVIKGEKVS